MGDRLPWTAPAKGGLDPVAQGLSGGDLAAQVKGGRELNYLFILKKN